MTLVQDVQQFIQQPYPLWENELTQKLVQHKWSTLKQYGITTADDYSTARGWFTNIDSPVKNIKALNPDDTDVIYLEAPSFEVLRPFYEEHGLEVATEDEIYSRDAVTKLQKALSILRQIEPAYQCVTQLVRRIQVLQQEDPEIDVSYSHPSIPFSIFVTVCEDDSEVSSLRVAESILHEAMHLKLTLIEEVTPLVKENASDLFYSPWREEERPVQGVLHGLFVFRAINNFYFLITTKNRNSIIEKFICCRMKDISLECNALSGFETDESLMPAGKQIVKVLLQKEAG